MTDLARRARQIVKNAGKAAERRVMAPASLHEILATWQAGRMSARRAMGLSGIEDVGSLYAAAASSGVKMRTDLLQSEEAAAARATTAIRRAMTEAASSGCG